MFVFSNPSVLQLHYFKRLHFNFTHILSGVFTAREAEGKDSHSINWKTLLKTLLIIYVAFENVVVREQSVCNYEPNIQVIIFLPWILIVLAISGGSTWNKSYFLDQKDIHSK